MPNRYILTNCHTLTITISARSKFDRNNGLWLAADAAGVSHIKTIEPSIATFAIPHQDKRGSRDNGIKGLFKMKSGDIVASTFNDQNYIVNTDNATLTPYTLYNNSISAYTVDHSGDATLS